MISLCTVAIAGMEPYLQVLRDTVSRNCSLVSEVLIARTAGRPAKDSGFTHHAIEYRLFDVPTPNPDTYCGHAYGLHACIDRAKNDYLLFCDPDCYFITPPDELPADEFYLWQYEKYDLNIIGISHFSPDRQCYRHFPCVINCLVRKSTLPNPDWLVDDLYICSDMKRKQPAFRRVRPVPGKFLIPGPTSLRDRFPNPTGVFDVGSNLWWWNEEKQGRWLTFPYPYYRQYYTTNFGLVGNLGDGPLVRHMTGGSREPGIRYLRDYKIMTGRQPTDIFALHPRISRLK